MADESITPLVNPTVEKQPYLAFLNPSTEQTKNVCNWYGSFIIVLTLLLNYLWISPDLLKQMNHIYAVQNFYCYLYAVSIVSLLILCLSCKPRVGYARQKCSVSWTSFATTIFLWIFSMIFCCYFLASFYSGAKK